MIKSIVILLIASIFSINKIYSQVVEVGMSLPDHEFRDVLNYKSKTLRLSDLDKKIIIFDFWGPTCVPCIQALPKLEALQKQYDKEIQIILVNTDSKDSTLRFFASRKRVRMPGLLMITGDSLLNQALPHST